MRPHRVRMKKQARNGSKVRQLNLTTRPETGERRYADTPKTPKRQPTAPKATKLAELSDELGE